MTLPTRLLCLALLTVYGLCALYFLADCAVLYDRMGRRAVILSGPVRGRYEVQRGRTLIVWVSERDVATWTTAPQDSP